MGKTKKQRLGVGGGGISRPALWRLAKRHMPEGCRFATETYPALAKMIEEEVGGILLSAVEGRYHKTLKPEDLPRGVERWHKRWVAKNMGGMLEELNVAVGRLKNIHDIIVEVEDDSRGKQKEGVEAGEGVDKEAGDAGQVGRQVQEEEASP